MGTGNTVRKELRNGKFRWIIDFRYRGKDGQERRYRRDASVQTAAGARVEADRLQLLAITNGTLDPPPPAQKFKEFVEGPFTTTFLPTRCRAATRERYLALFKQGIMDAFGNKRLNEITPQDFRAYTATLVARGIQTRAHLGLIRTVIRTAVEYGALATSPELPKLPRPGRKLPTAPSEETVENLLLHATGWLRVAIALALYAGLRAGEIRGIASARRGSEAESDHRASRTIAGGQSDSKIGTRADRSARASVARDPGRSNANKLPQASVVVTSEGTIPNRQALLGQ
ncbi:MAG TPA: hypothetical protein VHO25_04950 [Polyangiaceae bacterium]|nr:hypothetical protein [Polyangiaceae bacterium]